MDPQMTPGTAELLAAAEIAVAEDAQIREFEQILERPGPIDQVALRGLVRNFYKTGFLKGVDYATRLHTEIMRRT